MTRATLFASCACFGLLLSVSFLDCLRAVQSTEASPAGVEPVPKENIRRMRDTLRRAISKALRKNVTLVEDLVEALVGLDIEASQLDVQRLEDHAVAYIMEGVNGNREMISYLGSVVAERGADVQSYIRDMVVVLTHKHDSAKTTALIQQYILGTKPTMDDVADFFKQLLISDVQSRRDLLDRLVAEFTSVGVDLGAVTAVVSGVLNQLLQDDELVVDKLVEIALGDNDEAVVALMAEYYEDLQSVMMKLSSDDILTTRKVERDVRAVTTAATRRR